MKYTILKRKTQKEGTIRIAREKEFYEKPTAMRKRKIAAATKRHKRNIKIAAKNDVNSIVKAFGQVWLKYYL